MTVDTFESVENCHRWRFGNNFKNDSIDWDPFDKLNMIEN
jgi:hypothetical protein